METEIKNPVEETTEIHSVTPDEPEPTLEIQDIAYCKQIIETASTRGAFQANELHVIGLTYDRISSWLASVTEPTEPADNDIAEQGEKND